LQSGIHGLGKALGVAHEEQKHDDKALSCYLVAIRNMHKLEANRGCRNYNNITARIHDVDLAKKAMNSSHW
jgi:hypothetical protein